MADTADNGARILIVEDNRDAALALVEIMGAYGYDVEAAHTGSDGLAAWRGGGHDVVICDLSLPDMNGIDVARAINNEREDVRLFALTGNPGNRAELEAAGFEKILVKPVSWATLQAALQA